MKPNFAPGPDGMTATLIKNFGAAMSVPLTLLWMESFQTRKVPKCYKHSFVTLIHKKGDKITPANHRPRSLTSHSIKTAERDMRKIMAEYLEKN